MTKLTPVADIPAYAVIIRAVHGRGTVQAEALAELNRRGLWLSDDQKRQAELATNSQLFDAAVEHQETAAMAHRYFRRDVENGNYQSAVEYAEMAARHSEHARHILFTKIIGQ